MTAMHTAERFHLPIHLRSSLREYNWGAAEGMNIKEREELFGDKIRALYQAYPYWKDRFNFTPVPDSETITQLIERFNGELLNISESHLGQKIAIFSHGRAIRSFLISLLDSEDVPALENCEYVEILYSSENIVQPFSFVRTEHLAPD